MRTINERADVIPLVAEVFRELGFEGATLSRITERTGLGKGTLYHFFPGGKDDMAKTILAEIDAGSNAMCSSRCGGMIRRRRSPACGRRSTIISAPAGASAWSVPLRSKRRGTGFPKPSSGYFSRWIEALRDALVRAGRDSESAALDAEDMVAGIQGALVLSRATGDRELFSRSLGRLQTRLGI